MKRLFKPILTLLASIKPEESLNDKQQPSEEQRERFMQALELEERKTVSSQTRHLFHQALDAHRNGGKL